MARPAKLGDGVQAFAVAFASSWLAKVSGGFGVPLTAIGTFWPDGPVRAVALCVGIIGLVVAAFSVWQRERRDRIKAEAALANTPNIPERNMSATDLFRYLEPNPLTATFRDVQSEMGSIVSDELSTGRLVAWGRENRRHGPLVGIKRDFWERGTRWSFDYKSEGTQEFIQVDPVLPDGGIHYFQVGQYDGGYLDLWFDSAQVKKLWPSPGRAIDWPDYEKWDKKDPLRVFEAATLWADEEPERSYPAWPTDTAEQAYRTIINPAFLDGELPVDNDPSDTPDHFKNFAAEAKPLRANQYGWVTREALMSLERAKGDRPKFLFSNRRATLSEK